MEQRQRECIDNGKDRLADGADFGGGVLVEVRTLHLVESIFDSKFGECWR